MKLNKKYKKMLEEKDVDDFIEYPYDAQSFIEEDEEWNKQEN